MGDKTKEAYEQQDFVEMYIDTNSTKEHELVKARNFASSLDANSVVMDLGCGPGHTAFELAAALSQQNGPLNHTVIGTDLSEAMIEAAKKFKKQENMPSFEVLDMTKLGEKYEENSLDAIYANASLLHLDMEQTDQVLTAIVKVVKKQGKVFISLKGGETETKMVLEKKNFNGKELEFERQFTFWSKDVFEKYASKFGLKMYNFESQINTATSGAQTEWLNFYFTVEK